MAYVWLACYTTRIVYETVSLCIKPKYFTNKVLKIDAFWDFWALVKCVNLLDMTVLRKIIFRIVQKEETVEYYTNYNYKTGSQKAIALIRQAKV